MRRFTHIQRGFSLIEMVAMLAMLAVVLGVAILTMLPNLAQSHLLAAAKQVSSDIEFAKLNATKTGVLSGVNFVNGGTYTVYQSTTATPLKSPLTQQNLVVTLSSSFPSVSISQAYIVEFDKMGKPTTGGGGTVTLSSGSNSKVISVSANTGKVTIQ
jgi:prepilin-type N-terminal cleavage/methylation domain-containing protein